MMEDYTKWPVIDRDMLSTRFQCIPLKQETIKDQMKKAWKKKLLSIAIISLIRNSQKNKLQKLSVFGKESEVLQIEWL